MENLKAILAFVSKVTQGKVKVTQGIVQIFWYQININKYLK